MQEVMFTVQTITPLIMSGANQYILELRPPSLRGLMRYWQRTVVGGGKSLDTVIQTETDIFGSTKQRSAINIRVIAPPLRPTRNIDPNAKGMNYLLWPSAQKTGRTPRPFAEPSVTFQVKLSLPEKKDTEPISPILEQAIGTLWLLTHFGGIGLRSRHCAGSVVVKSITGMKPTWFSCDLPKTSRDLKNQLENGLLIVRNLYQLGNSFTQKSMFEVLSPNISSIWILQYEKPWNSSKEAMNTIGNSLYRASIPLIQGGPVRRRASPLLLRISKLQDEKYVGLAILFKTEERIPRDYMVGPKVKTVFGQK